MGVSPHLLVQSVHEGRTHLLRGCPPLPFWLGSCPLLSSSSLYAVLWGRTLLGGSPWGVGWILPPPVCACRALGAHAARGLPPPRYLVSRGSPPPAWACRAPVAHSALRGVPPFLCAEPARRWRTRSVPCTLFVLVRGGPPPSWSGMTCARSACCRIGGSPFSPCLCPWAVGARDPSPPTFCPRMVCARGWGGGIPFPTWSPSSGGSQGCPLGGSPPCSCCTPLARAAEQGFTPPLPPLYGRSR